MSADRSADEGGEESGESTDDGQGLEFTSKDDAGNGDETGDETSAQRRPTAGLDALDPGEPRWNLAIGIGTGGIVVSGVAVAAALGGWGGGMTTGVGVLVGALGTAGGLYLFADSLRTQLDAQHRELRSIQREMERSDTRPSLLDDRTTDLVRELRRQRDLTRELLQDLPEQQENIETLLDALPQQREAIRQLVRERRERLEDLEQQL